MKLFGAIKPFVNHYIEDNRLLKYINDGITINGNTVTDPDHSVSEGDKVTISHCTFTIYNLGTMSNQEADYIECPTCEGKGKILND